MSIYSLHNLQQNLGGMSHNVSAVYNVFAVAIIKPRPCRSIDKTEKDLLQLSTASSNSPYYRNIF
jgi:hypothetical protein